MTGMELKTKEKEKESSDRRPQMALYVWRFKGHPQCRAGDTDVYLIPDRQGRLLYMSKPRGKL
jgi:hypothetical protein